MRGHALVSKTALRSRSREDCRTADKGTGGGAGGTLVLICR